MRKQKSTEFEPPARARVGKRRLNVYNVEVCAIVLGTPFGVNVRVWAKSPPEARKRASDVLLPYWDGIDLPDYGQLTEGESVRLCVDTDFIDAGCSVYDE